MQKSDVQRQIERTELPSIHSLGTFSIDAANALSIVGLVFGGILTYHLVFSRPAAPSVERAAADETVTHVQAASDFAP